MDDGGYIVFLTECSGETADPYLPSIAIHTLCPLLLIHTEMPQDPQLHDNGQQSPEFNNTPQGMQDLTSYSCKDTANREEVKERPGSTPTGKLHCHCLHSACYKKEMQALSSVQASPVSQDQLKLSRKTDMNDGKTQLPILLCAGIIKLCHQCSYSHRNITNSLMSLNLYQMIQESFPFFNHEEDFLASQASSTHLICFLFVLCSYIQAPH